MQQGPDRRPRRDRGSSRSASSPLAAFWCLVRVEVHDAGSEVLRVS